MMCLCFSVFCLQPCQLQINLVSNEWMMTTCPSFLFSNNTKLVFYLYQKTSYLNPLIDMNDKYMHITVNIYPQYEILLVFRGGFAVYENINCLQIVLDIINTIY